jgi:hypothetical protein
MAVAKLKIAKVTLPYFTKERPKVKTPRGMRIKKAPEAILWGRAWLRGTKPIIANATEPKIRVRMPKRFKVCPYGKLFPRLMINIIVSMAVKTRPPLKKILPGPSRPSRLKFSLVH